MESIVEVQLTCNAMTLRIASHLPLFVPLNRETKDEVSAIETLIDVDSGAFLSSSFDKRASSGGQ